jgi:hypothetical protein
LRLGGEEFGAEEEGEATSTEEGVEFFALLAGKRGWRSGLEATWGRGHWRTGREALIDSILEREALTGQGVRRRRQGI